MLAVAYPRENNLAGQADVHGLGTQMTLIGRTNTESKMSVVVSEDSTGTRYMNFADGPNQDIFQVAFAVLRRGEVLVTVVHTKDALPVTVEQIMLAWVNHCRA